MRAVSTKNTRKARMIRVYRDLIEYWSAPRMIALWQTEAFVADRLASAQASLTEVLAS